MLRMLASFFCLASLAQALAAHAQVTVAPPEGLPPKYATFAVSPSILTLDIGGKTASGALTLYNMGQAPISVEVSVHNWELDENSQIKTIPPSPQSLDQWIVINPVKFDVQGGKWQTVRVSVRPRAKPEPGEHRAMIYFRQIPGKSADSKSVSVVFRFGVAVYGLAGEIKRAGELHEIKLETVEDYSELSFDVSSLGNANVRMSGQALFWSEKSFNPAAEPQYYQLQGAASNAPPEVLGIAEIPRTPILPGTRRIMKMKIKNPQAPGKYILQVHGMLNDEPFKSVFPVTVESLQQ